MTTFGSMAAALAPSLFALHAQTVTYHVGSSGADLSIEVAPVAGPPEERPTSDANRGRASIGTHPVELWISEDDVSRPVANADTVDIPGKWVGVPGTATVTRRIDQIVSDRAIEGLWRVRVSGGRSG